ncbi:MAG: hypothetical protein K5876_00680 [Ruminiclostridium sp.]|nr:hypothetical protein [Ruminiclostridium sp.]
MEWKKEKIGAAELERRQREYMNAAMSMVKRSAPVPEPEPEPEPEPVPTAEPVIMPEPEPVHEPEPEPEPEPAAEAGPEAGESEKYGVYTADELLGDGEKDDGMKRAAEILEEMTRNTEMMRKLAEEGEDGGTTDFPEFSCGTGGEGERFRDGEEGTLPEDD